MTYRRRGGPEVLTLTDLPVPEPGLGEVRVRMVVSAVNPTDWKARSGVVSRGDAELSVPNQDGAGVVDALGADVDGFAVGDRVWVLLAAAHSPLSGTAQEYVVLPADRLVALPDETGFDEGAAFAIPALTAHRALTVSADGPARLAPNALSGKTILVSGGAGAVGNSAIQLARWAGATVIATVSTETKAELARAAGAQHVVRYTEQDVAAEVRKIAPDGVDVIVEVAAGVNAPLHAAVLRTGGTVGVYGDVGGTGSVTVEFGQHVYLNTRYQFLVLYTVGFDNLRAGAEDLTAAFRDGGLRLGPDHGLPVHRFPLAETARAHEASEHGITGKILIDVS